MVQRLIGGERGRIPVEGNAMVVAISQAFNRFGGKSNYKDNGIGCM